MASLESDQRCIGDWIVGSLLGSGSFAVVWKAEHRATAKPAAIKEINLSRLNARLRQSLESEVSILKRISHRNVVQLYEVLEAHGRLFIVMEYCAGGDLAQLLKSRGRLPEPTVSALMQDFATGLQEMWRHHLVHRDLKPQNLLLATPASPDRSAPPPVLKIADFGFARALGPQLMAETLCGSPLYMAPEILLSQRYDAKADLWSVGAILFEALAGAPPYTGANQVALLRSIREREARLPPAVTSELSAPCRALVYALLRRNAVERISFEEFFNHPFVTGNHTADNSTISAALSARETALSRHSGPQQHVIGFGGGDLGGTTAGAVPPPAAVPVSQLTEQFRPRLVSIRHPVQQQRIGPIPPSPRAPAKPPQLHATNTMGSSHSSVDDDDEYVLVTASAAEAAATGLGEQQQQLRSGQTPPTQEGALPRSAGVGRGVVRGGAPQEAFLLARGDENGNALGGGRTGMCSSSFGGGPMGPIPDAVPWQEASRRQFLQLVAGILDSLGCEAGEAGAAAAAAAMRKDERKHKEVGMALARQLSFQIAALQLYEVVLSGWGKPAEDDTQQAKQQQHSMHSSLGSADSGPGDLEPVRSEAAAVLRRAEAAAVALQKLKGDGGSVSSLGSLDLPNPWQASHKAALRWAEEAASEELLGNYGRSEALYCRAGMVLHFLAAEARTLPCKPPPQVAAADEVRLRRCASAAAVRWAVCTALARREAAAGGDWKE